MFTIRHEQMTSMSDEVMKKFEGRLFAHLVEVFPKKSAALGDEKLREFVKDGIAKAQEYNIVSERDIARFVDLMMIVRRDLDLARETPWAKTILKDETLSGEEKVGRLYAAARRNRFKINDDVPPPPGQAPASGPVPGRPAVTPRPMTQTRPATPIQSVPPL